MICNFLKGIEIKESNMVPTHNVLLPKRKAKSVRLKKKFKSKYGFNVITKPDKVFYICGRTLIAHKDNINKLKKFIDTDDLSYVNGMKVVKLPGYDYVPLPSTVNYIPGGRKDISVKSETIELKNVEGEINE